MEISLSFTDFFLGKSKHPSPGKKDELEGTLFPGKKTQKHDPPITVIFIQAKTVLLQAK